jgi:hemolysin III
VTTSIDTADSERPGSARGEAEDLPEALADGVAQFLGRPRARGWIHLYSAVVAFIAGAALVSVSWALEGTRAGLATLLYTFTIVAMFAVSATYHRVTWTSPTARKWMKRLDHSMIFVLIAGSYTPLTLLALQPAWGITLLTLAWTGAAVGVLITVLRVERWHRVGFAMYLGLGWLAVIAAPQLLRALSGAEVALLVAGGLLYTVGAIVLARNRPDPSPSVFGYHEVWHTLVVGAGACHFALMLLLVRG